MVPTLAVRGYIHCPRMVIDSRLIHGHGSREVVAIEHADATHEHHAAVLDNKRLVKAR
ncbi:hypothetical protein GA0115239_12633 [Streptomyces sp. BpilaLS-43]|nr:hypothetical protein GA0115239_12633 [Streptomyces sp. BpilaLS-43]